MKIKNIVLGATILLASIVGAQAGQSGTFKGLAGHTVSGGAKLEQRGKDWVIVLAKDFKFDGAPDPRIAFSNNGKFAKDTDFKLLKSDSGAQEYKVPKSIDPSKYSEIMIWCRKFTVALAVAKLK